MANFANLKAAINAVIKANGQREITGEVMNQVLTAMVNSLGSNYQFAGVATPSTNPGTPDQNVFYMATQAGTYTNFSAIVLQDGISILLWNGSWTSETFFTVDAVPTSGSNNFITSGAVFDKFKLDGGAYDVTAHNSNATFADLSALLNSENLNTLIPVAVRHGGMSIKFVLTSDNNYVKFFCTADEFTTDVTKWQGVDDEPTTGSENLVKSGGVLGSIIKNGSILTIDDADVHQVLTSSDIDNPNGTRIRLVYKINKGAVIGAGCSLGKGIAAVIYSTKSDALKAGSNYLQTFRGGSYREFASFFSDYDGYLALSLCKSDETAFTPEEKTNYINATFVQIINGDYGKLIERYSKSFTQVVSGKGMTVITFPLLLEKGKQYFISVNDDWTITSDDTTKAKILIGKVVGTDLSFEFRRGVHETGIVNIAFSADPNVDYYYIGFRADAGQQVKFLIKQLNDGVENELNDDTHYFGQEVGFVGNGDIYQTGSRLNVKPTTMYHLVVEQPNFAIPTLSEDSLIVFELKQYDSSDNLLKRDFAINYANRNNIPSEGDFITLMNTAYIKIGGRSVSDIVKCHIYELEEHIKTPATFETGYWSVTDGSSVSSDIWGRTPIYVPNDVDYIVCPSDTFVLIQAFDENDNYIGTWYGNGWTDQHDSNYRVSDINIAQFRENYPTYRYKLSCRAITSPWGGYERNIYISSVKKEVIGLQKDFSEVRCIYGDVIKESEWVHKTINSQGQQVDNNNPYQRISSKNFIRILTPLTIFPSDGCGFSVNKYALDGTFISQFTEWCTTAYTISDTDAMYKIVIKKTPDEDLIIENIGDYIQCKILVATPFERILTEIANTKAVNHRGYNFIAPENTLIAFEMSAQYGYKFVETDVLFTSDGVPVLMHDATINRTARNSDGTELSEPVRIEDITYQQALTYDYGIYKGEQFAGTKIPTLEEFMYCCKANNLHPWIELKNEHIYTLAEIQQIISIVRQYGMDEHVSFISFSYDALALVRDEWDTVELGINSQAGLTNARNLRTGKNRVFVSCGLYEDHNYVINAGFPVCVYTIDTIGQLNLIPHDIDSILTDGILPSQLYNTIQNKYNAIKQS